MWVRILPREPIPSIAQWTRASGCGPGGRRFESCWMVHFQGVAQPGSAPGPEPGGRRFESYRPDHFAQARTTGGCHATQRLRPTAVLSKPRASGGEGYASETQVRRGDRVVHGDKELIEKLGRNDLCPCGSGRRFQKMLPALRPLGRQRAQLLYPRLAHGESCRGLRRVGRAARHRGANATRPKGRAGSTPALSATLTSVPSQTRSKQMPAHKRGVADPERKAWIGRARDF